MYSSRTIKMYLAEGIPTGIKIIELVGWVGKGFIIPRNSIKEALKREELKYPSVYFLIGKDENNEDMVYVGESENFSERILDHQRKKDFWNTAICFISANDFLHKGNIKYLESILIREIQKVDRVCIDLGKNSAKPHLSESEEADILSFAEYLKIILSAIGFIFLKKATDEPAEKEELYYCSGKGVRATGIPTTEGFVTLKGSVVSSKEAQAIFGRLASITRFQVLQSSKVRKTDEGNYELLDDLTFSSPSHAAVFVLGTSINGWKAWKNKAGKTLDEVKRQNI